MDKTIRDLCSEWGKSSSDTAITRGAVFIPDWRPASLNSLVNAHWSQAHSLKKRDKQIVAACTRSVPKATGKRRIDLHIDLGKHQRRYDADNGWKSVLDALTSCGMIKDDSGKWLELGTVEFGRNYETPGTWILWQDLQ